jgi:alpha-galactosidase
MIPGTVACVWGKAAVKLAGMRTVFVAILFGVIMALPAFGDDRRFVVPEEVEAKRVFLAKQVLEKAPISFDLGGRKSSEVLAGFKRTVETKELGRGRTQHTVTFTDPAGALEIRLLVVAYADFPVVEWTAYLKNTGKAETAVLSDVRGIDVGVFTEKTVTLRSIRGDDNTANAYAPVTIPLTEKAATITPVGGRPSNGAFPYFNLDQGGRGMILALGWPGQWSAAFSQDKAGVRIVAGQERTKLKLLPGEEIRTPLCAVLFWGSGTEKTDWIYGQNLWRRWMVAHNVPRPNGKLPGTFTAACMGLHQSVETEKTAIDAYLKAGITFDYWWMDAGWYEGPEWWAAKGVGTWTPDPARFPKGIREVSDYVHSKKMKLILWFEPERVYRGSYLWEKHVEWHLPWPDKDNFRALNLGNPDARRWITDHISKFITEQGVDLYRQDHNVDSLGAWKKNDAGDREGMTENLYVQGYLAFWDELLKNHPGMLIDSCASGGRRNDLETLRRSVPLLRSDFQAPAQNPPQADVDSGNQNHTRGLAQWIPYYGTGVDSKDTYSFRSHLCPSMGMGTDLSQPELVKRLQKSMAEYREIAPLFYGDFYPLTAYGKGEDTWAAWQFHKPEEEVGMVQVFRREASPYTAATFRLRGLEAGKRYVLTDMDTGQGVERDGRALMEKGVSVEMAEVRSAKIFTVKAK